MAQSQSETDLVPIEAGTARNAQYIKHMRDLEKEMVEELRKSRKSLSNSRLSFQQSIRWIKSMIWSQSLSLLTSFLWILGLLFLPQPFLFLRLLYFLFQRSDLILDLTEVLTEFGVLRFSGLDLFFELILLGGIRGECSKILLKHFKGIRIGYTLVVLLFGPESKQN